MADFQGKQFFQRHKSGIEKGLLAVAIVLILLVAVLFVFCMRAEKVVAPASMPTLPTTTTTVPTTTTIATTTTKVTYDYTMKSRKWQLPSVMLTVPKLPDQMHN